jgi:hypothetical protein
VLPRFNISVEWRRQNFVVRKHTLHSHGRTTPFSFPAIPVKLGGL